MCSSLSLLQIRWTFEDSTLYYKDAIYQETARAGLLAKRTWTKRAPTTQESSPSPKQGRPKAEKSSQEYPKALSQWQGRSKVRPGNRSTDKDKVQQLPGRSIIKPEVNPSWGAAWAAAMLWLYRWSALLQCSYIKTCQGWPEIELWNPWLWGGPSWGFSAPLTHISALSALTQQNLEEFNLFSFISNSIVEIIGLLLLCYLSQGTFVPYISY